MKERIDGLLEKYWAGETELSEEKELRQYFLASKVAEEHHEFLPMFRFFEDQKHLNYPGEIDLTAITGSKSKEPIRRTLFRPWMAAAACIALLVIFMLPIFNASGPSAYVNNEEISQDEAYEITKEALAFLSVKYEKGSEPMKHIKQLENTNIFRFKN